MNTPSYSVLLNRDKQIKAIQELYENVNGTETDINTLETSVRNLGLSVDALELGAADEDILLTNSMTTAQEKQIALNSVASLMVTYGYTASTIESLEWESIILDSENKIVMGKRRDGVLFIFGKEYSS